jgi:ubiquinone/menaquinone biosynthesis C-methylase UbiE
VARQTPAEPPSASVDGTARLAREAEFHDQVFVDESRADASRFYAVASRSKSLYRQRVLRDCRGLDVLEYGCGPGSCAFDLARFGARVTGIDISPGAIELARQQAAAEGLSESLRLEVMNAESLPIDAGSYDRVCGSGILHHLDLSKALGEIRRVLRPTGDAVFFEPLGHNPLINWYRRRTPSMRTVDEHPLLAADLYLMASSFEASQVNYYHLTSLAAAFWPGRRGGSGLRWLLDVVDRGLLSLPWVRRQAWIVIAELEKPIQ